MPRSFGEAAVAAGLSSDFGAEPDAPGRRAFHFGADVTAPACSVEDSAGEVPWRAGWRSAFAAEIALVSARRRGFAAAAAFEAGRSEHFAAEPSFVPGCSSEFAAEPAFAACCTDFPRRSVGSLLLVGVRRRTAGPTAAAPPRFVAVQPLGHLIVDCPGGAAARLRLRVRGAPEAVAPQSSTRVPSAARSMQPGFRDHGDAVVQAIDSTRASRVARRLGQALGALIRKGNQRFTVMLIPHSERRTFNLQLSVFTLVFLCVLLAVILSAFLVLSTHFTTTNERMAAVNRSLAASELALATVGDEIIALQGAMEEFRGSLDQLLRVLGSRSVTASAAAAQQAGDGDLAAFVSQSQVAAAGVPGVTELRQLRAALDVAMTPLADLNATVAAQVELLVDIPTLWPVRGGAGWVSFEFGPQRHPFTNAFYIHRGIDIALRRGAEIVATANGTVQRVDFERYNLGNVIEIQHKYGFVTRYGHLQRVLVAAGQTVQRGQIIGLMGNTGLSTGPHVHYEVSIGAQLRDPSEFLAISALTAVPAATAARR